ncbi:response regulator [Arenibacter troitsensis]|uniref:Response regulator receiver domain-containing protein n=1 Tax=Arenibacter troitsensis TaxID=188872 RepID=A0A1X7HUT6_9FLAO|nr:response regulator [Arenibacter troitsensis]MDX1767063.1 response regulator [Arenibacter troitsensis]SMG05677.1 Response regulator receiver domain-containing protein [Arenibacter troitsensis]|tara:strand:- start:374 stop:769 length:396 start_codon:yes stop_codon:yes gene_type:complete
MTINTICIIDDDPIFVFGSKILLRNNSFASDYLVCQNGQEALDTIIPLIESEERLPEVIFLDLNMPIMDGWEFLDEFGKISRESGIRIYILSSSVDSRDLERAKKYDIVSGFIAKPLTDVKIKELAQEIEG